MCLCAYVCVAYFFMRLFPARSARRKFLEILFEVWYAALSKIKASFKFFMPRSDFRESEIGRKAAARLAMAVHCHCHALN